MFIEVNTAACGETEQLFKLPDQEIDPALYAPGVVLGLIVPESGKGDFSLVQKVEKGMVTLMGLTVPRKGVYKVEELLRVRPQLVITVPKTGLFAVEPGAVYQEVESGLCYEVQDHCWRQIGQTAWATLPFLPKMILRDSPSF